MLLFLLCFAMGSVGGLQRRRKGRLSEGPLSPILMQSGE